MAKPNPLQRAHATAENDTARLGELFASLGNTENPDTPILTAYRNANRALRNVIESGAGTRAVKDITRGLRLTVSDSVIPVFSQARQDGAKSAKTQLGYYGLVPPDDGEHKGEIEAAYGVIESRLDAQEAALMALIMSDSDESLILGDDSRQGVLKPFDVISPAIFWLTWLFWGGFDWQVGRSKKAEGFSKQVIAALDHRTTDCCLRAHGQVVGINEKFHLTGTPRYADYMEWTPFHAYCRSSIALYLPGYDDGLTEAMRESADRVIAERGAGINKTRHPANAFAF